MRHWSRTDELGWNEREHTAVCADGWALRSYVNKTCASESDSTTPLHPASLRRSGLSVYVCACVWLTAIELLYSIVLCCTLAPCTSALYWRCSSAHSPASEASSLETRKYRHQERAHSGQCRKSRAREEHKKAKERIQQQYQQRNIGGHGVGARQVHCNMLYRI